MKKSIILAITICLITLFAANYQALASNDQICVYQESAPGAGDFGLIGTIDVFDRSSESAAVVYSCSNPDGAYYGDIRLQPCCVVDVDIKPTSCPNPLNVKAKGVMSIAILGTESHDVTMVDPATVKLQGVVFPIRWALEDVATPFNGATKDDCEDCTEDGPDGYLDLTLKFDTQEVVAALGEVEDGECVMLILTGNLKEEFGGILIAGKDYMVIK